MCRHIRHLAEVFISHGYRDRAVFYMLLSRILNLGFGPLIVIAVGAYLDPDQQGVYYVFGSLLQLRSLIDLGFSPSSQQLLANRFAGLSLSHKNGTKGNELERQQFLNLAKYICHMYVWLGLLTIAIVGLLGDHFLAQQLKNHPQLVWRGSWWVMISSVGLCNSMLGIVVVADGANQVAFTNKWRFWNELSALASFVVVLVVGGGLWASAAMAAARLWLVIPILGGLGRAFLSQIAAANAKSVSFKKEILPLQAPTMVVWGMGFLCYYAYNPLALKFLGPAFAGVVGMSLQIANMASSLALVWYNTKLSKLGNLAGNHQHGEAMELHTFGVKLSLIFWAILAVGAWLITFLLKQYLPDLGTRIAPMWPMTLFLLGSGAFIWTHVRASYIRAFCIEMFAPPAIAQGIGTFVLLWLTLPHFGILGAALTYFIMMLIGALWIEKSYRSFVGNGNSVLKIKFFA